MTELDACRACHFCVEKVVGRYDVPALYCWRYARLNPTPCLDWRAAQAREREAE